MPLFAQGQIDTKCISCNKGNDGIEALLEYFLPLQSDARVSLYPF